MEQVDTERSRAEQGGEEFGDYLLERLLGAGAMGEVWEATDRTTNRKVAIKRLAPHLIQDEDGRKRFEREARLASRLRDPHIVPIHRYGEIDGRFFLDMQLVEGRDLEQVLQVDGALPPARAVAIVEQIAHALATAHKAGLVHRDVKPSNILIAQGHDGSDIAYLADFGISRPIDVDAHTRTSGVAIVGTLTYMAPEQFDGKASRQSDLYSLGCVLFECLTGSPPFPVNTVMEALSSHAFAEPPRVSQRAPWLSSSLDGVVIRAMQKDPAARQVSVMDFSKASRVALGGAELFRSSPIGKTNPTGRRAGKRSRRSLRVIRTPEQQPVNRVTEPGATVWTDPSWATRPPRVSPQRKVVLMGAAIATAVILLVSAVVVGVSLNRESSAAPPAAPTATPEFAPLVSSALPRLKSTLSVPGRPETVAVSPLDNGRFAYMTTADGNPGAVHKIDTGTNRVVASVEIPGVPRFVATNPTTGSVYVSYNNEAQNRLEVAGIEKDAFTIVKTIRTGQPADRKYGQTWLFVFAFSPDGKKIYIPHHNQSVVSVLDTDTNVATAQLKMPKNPHSVSVSREGRWALVAAHMSGVVDVFNAQTDTFVRSIPIGPGASPHDVDISPDGRWAHVANFDAGTVSVIDMNRQQVAATVPVGGKPQSVVFSEDSRRSFVVDNQSNTLHTIDADTKQITGSVPVTPGASMVALSPDGARAYVASRDSSTITTMQTAS